tara:strand:+ start:8018 stop:8617 length:600 start_codon:yes stop_codon:yes gene_type:complete
MRQNSVSHDLGGAHLTLDIVKNLVESGQFTQFTFCGQISDPMVHPNMVPILEYCRHKVKVEMHVAASHKPERYWRECFAANPEAKYIFGIDGLPHKSHLYRINQDGEKLFDMMLISKYEFKMDSSWNHIIFKYNEDEIDQCRELAKEHNIRFQVVKSGRFFHETLAVDKAQELRIIEYNDKYLPTNPDNFVGARMNAKT